MVGPHRLYNVIGYVSSAGGLLVLALAAARWYRLAPAGGPATGLPRRTRTWLGAGFGVAAYVAGWYLTRRR